MVYKKSYDFQSVNFALGGGTVGTYTEGTYESCYEDGPPRVTFSFSGTMTIHYFDIFEEPFRTGFIGIPADVSTPYAYEHEWKVAIEIKKRVAFYY